MSARSSRRLSRRHATPIGPDHSPSCRPDHVWPWRGWRRRTRRATRTSPGGRSAALPSMTIVALDDLGRRTARRAHSHPGPRSRLARQPATRVRRHAMAGRACSSASTMVRSSCSGRSTPSPTGAATPTSSTRRAASPVATSSRIRVDVTDAGQALLTTPAADEALSRPGPLAHPRSQPHGQRWLHARMAATGDHRVRRQPCPHLDARRPGATGDVHRLGRAVPGSPGRWRSLCPGPTGAASRGAPRRRVAARRAAGAAGRRPGAGAPWGLGERTALATLVAVTPGDVSTELLGVRASRARRAADWPPPRASPARSSCAPCATARERRWRCCRRCGTSSGRRSSGGRPVLPRIWAT